MGDVGQNTREEIDVQKASNPGGGENYGWRLREGTIATPTGGVGGPAPPGAIDPILDYTHTSTGQAVIGGYVYHGAGVPSLQGLYVFGDLLGPENSMTNPNNLGRIFTLQYNGTTATNFTDITSQLFGGTGFTLVNPHSFGVDASGELYLVDGAAGAIYKIVAAPVAGDVNLDGIVNGLDISLVSANWLATGTNQADANHDGVVNGLDIALISSHWLQVVGSSGGGAAVPEPSTIVLAAVAGVVLLAYRRRRRSPRAISQASPYSSVPVDSAGHPVRPSGDIGHAGVEGHARLGREPDASLATTSWLASRR